MPQSDGLGALVVLLLLQEVFHSGQIYTVKLDICQGIGW